jgi:hypothetical protein
MNAPKEKPKGLKDLSAISFGYTSAIGFFLCFGAGYWADQKFQTGYLWTLTGFVVGIALMFYELWKIIAKSNNTTKKNK